MGHLHRLIVFDLDGTLIDSQRDLAASANALIVERGGEPLPGDAVARMIGEGARKLVSRALTAAGLPEDERSVSRFLELYDERLLETTRAYPGIPGVLELLARDHVVTVLTNKPLAPTRRLLDALNLSAFVSETFGGDGPFPRKPDPTGLRELMSRFDAIPGQTVMIGDSRIDFSTARAAGTRVCLTRYGFGFTGFPVDELRGDDGLVDEASEIPAVVRRLLNG